MSETAISTEKASLGALLVSGGSTLIVGLGDATTALLLTKADTRVVTSNHKENMLQLEGFFELIVFSF
jgi:hypothetical protein